MIVIVVIIISIIVGREVYVATHIQTCAYLPAVCTTNGNGLLLTFDDGPDEQNTPKVLSVLRKYNVKAVFFCIGSKALQHPEIVQRIVADGHIVGQHTFHHNPFRSFCSTNSYFAELKKAHEALRSVGVVPTLFRPPLGITNYMIKHAVQRIGYTTVGWSVRSFDTRRESRSKVISRVANNLRPDSIVLLHDRLNNSDEVAEAIITLAQKQNMAFCNPHTFFSKNKN